MARPKKPKTKIETNVTNEKRERYRLHPKTENQRTYIRTIAENQITLCNGPEGSGKSHIAVCYGIEKFLNGDYKRLIISRPAVEAGNELGFIKGTILDKMNPYLLPIYDELSRYINYHELQQYIKNGEERVGDREIVIAPVGFLRGRNFHDSVIVIDEAQNCTRLQLKLILTRLGLNSKMIINGSTTQIDIKDSGFKFWFDALSSIKEGIGCVTLDKSDIVRNPLISKILAAIGE